LPAVFVRSRATPLNDSIDRQKFRRKIPRHTADQKLVPKFTTGLEVWPIVTGKVTSAEQIAARDKCSMTISLVFLTSDLVRAAGFRKVADGIDRQNCMSRRQRSNLKAPADKERVRAD
jgi:hypothetical protein